MMPSTQSKTTFDPESAIDRLIDDHEARAQGDVRPVIPIKVTKQTQRRIRTQTDPNIDLKVQSAHNAEYVWGKPTWLRTKPPTDTERDRDHSRTPNRDLKTMYPSLDHPSEDDVSFIGSSPTNRDIKQTRAEFLQDPSLLNTCTVALHNTEFKQRNIHNEVSFTGHSDSNVAHKQQSTAPDESFTGHSDSTTVEPTDRTTATEATRQDGSFPDVDFATEKDSIWPQGAGVMPKDEYDLEVLTDQELAPRCCP